MPAPSMHKPAELPRRLHRITAAAVAAYVLIHLVNHLVALRGIEAHIVFMRALRQVSRVPAVETLLLLGVAVQAGSGLWMLLRRVRARIPRQLLFERLQLWSGAYLAFFLLVHVVSVLSGRAALGLDTNFYFAAAGLQIWPYPLFFLPYYGLAVAALFVHLACALRRRLPASIPLVARDRAAWGTMMLGVVLAVLIVAAFSGVFHPVDLPPAYRATFPERP
jgi:succinate dehydrogenase/fumarate reductase cytochrome b subunit